MITLEVAKAHLRVDFDDDDGIIEKMIAAASDHLASIGVDRDATPLPPAVEHAVLLLVGHFFANREAASNPAPVAIAIGVDRLIAPYQQVCL